MMGWRTLALVVLCLVAPSAALAQYEDRFKLLNHESWRKGWPTGSTAPEVLDRKTRLVWRRGFEESFYTWDTAVEHARSVAATTGKPWRMPSIEELAALMSVIRDDRMKDKTDIDFIFVFKTELSHIWIWSGSPHANPKFAWYINYNFAKPSYYYREYQGRARLVRPAEPGDFSGGPCTWVSEPRKKRRLECPADVAAKGTKP